VSGSSFEWDMSAWEDRLSKLSLDEPIVVQLDKLLESAYTASQMKVHIISGRLKASGHTTSTLVESVWTGEIVYDVKILPWTDKNGTTHTDKWTGMSYAWFEQRRGGSHDFLSQADSIMFGIDAMIHEWLAGTDL
jgi:hypothetical protein